MDIYEKAKDYAGGKATAALEQMIAQAYLDGYRDGYKDHKAEVHVNIMKEIEPEFVDLGLSSGTLWAKDYLKDENGRVIYLPYEKASKLSIPTEEQWEEMRRECTFSSSCIVFEDLNHNFYNLPYMGLKSGRGFSREIMSIWLKTEKIVDNQALRALYNGRYQYINHLETDVFMPVLLVK